MSVKRGLGRGFDALIPSDLLDESFDPTAGQDNQVSELRNIRIVEIHPDPLQPRQMFDQDALAELAASIRQHGIIQPLIVSPIQGGGYRIVAGERRYRAASDVGLEKVPALVRTLSDQHKLELSLIENIQRRDLTAIETATAYAKLRDQFNLSLEQIGERVGGRSASAISNTLRLLLLPKAAQQAIADGRLTEGQARPLIKLPPEIIEQLLPRIIEEGWSSRRIEQVAAHLKSQQQPTKLKTGPVKHYVNETGRIAQWLSAPVDIKVGRQGKGTVVISFNDDEDLQRILTQLDRKQSSKSKSSSAAKFADRPAR